jgi:hypothetical protein
MEDGSFVSFQFLFSVFYFPKTKFAGYSVKTTPTALCPFSSLLSMRTT